MELNLHAPHTSTSYIGQFYLTFFTTAMTKTGVEEQFHIFLISLLYTVWFASHPGHFNTTKRAKTPNGQQVGRCPEQIRSHYAKNV